VLLAGSISLSSPLDPGKAVINANDLDISHATGAVYFSASQDIAPAMHKRLGFYDTYEAYMLGLYSVGAAPGPAERLPGGCLGGGLDVQ
jgi:hypothetical protein